MQFKFAFVVAALATLAVATPTARNIPASDCSTADTQCCQSTTTVASLSSFALGLIANILGIAVGDITDAVASQCLNVAASTCSQQAVCCTNNAIGGLVSVGCIPITV